MIVFDHIAVTAATLDEGATHVERALDHRIGPGGRHALMGTHNRLSGIGDGAYLEVIAVDPEAAAPDRPRWFDLDRRSGPPRIGNWVARTDALDDLVARYPEAGRPLAFTRGEFRWRMAVPDDGALPFDGCFPALIEWQSPPPTFADTGLRFTSLTLRHPDGGALASILSTMTDDPRIRVEIGPPQISAAIDTPSGPRRLT